jgi:predicted GNAT superfamily acetyltransferase
MPSGSKSRQRKGSEVKYVIRPCRTQGELACCVELQKQIWGYSDLEVYPLRLFVNLGHIGGHVVGAFTARGKMVGFVGSLPAWRKGRRHFHSLSLGVLSGHENRGLGRALKLAQRRLALRAGVELIEWTFDPLRVKNAFFNIERLGAVCRRYIVDHYGAVDSRLQGGLPSDRLVAEWWIKSPRLRRALQGRAVRLSARPPSAEVVVPGEVGALRASQPARARVIQRAVRDKFRKCFARRLTVTGFVLDGPSGRYLLDAHED